LRFRDHGSYIDDIKRGDTVVFADAKKDSRTRATAQTLIDISAQAAINMPIVEHGRIVALLYLNHAGPREWPTEDLDFVRDVAMRTRAAVARREAELDLQALAASLERQVADRTAERDRMWKNSRDLFTAIDAGGILHQANPAWSVILGAEPRDVDGKSYVDFVVPEDVEKTAAAVSEAFVNGAVTAFPNRCRHKDGSIRWISWHASAESGLIYCYGRDLTEEKMQAEALDQAESALRQSQKMEAVGQLTGGIAHDFNNMLAVVIGSLELLARRVANDDTRAQRYLDAATEGAKRAALLTQRLLAFSRQQPLRPESIDANRLVSGMSDLLRHSLGAPIQLEAVLAGGLWHTHADPNQLENVILNLAVNARDAMPDGGRLTIETQNAHLDARYAAAHIGIAAGQYVLIAVTDTGCGMPEEVIAKAFDPFFTTKPVGKGTGLGLSQVYGFVKQSGGHVKIYSEPGCGTTVKIYLPRQAAGPQDSDVAGAAPLLPSGEHREIVLVVEDEPAVRALSVEVMSELGYHVLEAEGAAAALRLIETHPDIALLFTDVVMPEVNGRKLADEALRRRPNLKVLFTTGYTQNAVVHNGVLDAGVELIGKPFTIEELATKVRAVLDG
jgi:PAS domain S-box-containing protein